MKRLDFLKKGLGLAVVAAVPVTLLANTENKAQEWNELEDLKALLRANGGKYYYYHNCDWGPHNGYKWVMDDDKGFWSAVAFVGEEMHLCMDDNFEPLITPKLELANMYHSKDRKSIFYRIYELVKQTQKLGLKP